MIVVLSRRHFFRPEAVAQRCEFLLGRLLGGHGILPGSLGIIALLLGKTS